MSKDKQAKRADRRNSGGGVEFVPLNKKDVERSVTATLLQDKEAVQRIEGQFEEILQSWAEMGITPMTMVFLSTQLQELTTMIYREGYKEHVIGMWGKLSKKNREVHDGDFGNMCTFIRRQGLNAVLSRMETRKKECCMRPSNRSPQLAARGNGEATYVPSKERPSYIY